MASIYATPPDMENGVGPTESRSTRAPNALVGEFWTLSVAPPQLLHGPHRVIAIYFPPLLTVRTPVSGLKG